MPNTTNFNWATPADTDLVKDGAAAIRTLGSSIDTSFVDLKGGTTGQVLSKASNTDLDFTWTAGGDITEVQAGVGISVASGTGPIPVITNSSTDLITTAGDLLYGTAADTVARLGIGTAGQVLKVNSGATAPEWGSASAPADSWTLLNSGGTALSGSGTVTISFSAQNKLWIYIQAASAAADRTVQLRFNSDSGSNYRLNGYQITGTDTISIGTQNTTQWTLAYLLNDGSTLDGFIDIEGANGSGIKTLKTVLTPSEGDGGRGIITNGQYAGTSAITSINLICGGGNFDAGSVFVYGA